MRGFLIFLFVLLGLLTTAAYATPIPSLLSQGDESFKHRSAEDQARLALQSYLIAAEKTEYKDVETLWRVAMGSYFVGLRLTHEDAEKEKIFAQGRDAGFKALALKPDCAECHFWTAINMALYGDTVGVFKMLSSLKDIESHLQKTITLNPVYANGGAYRILGLIQQKLPGILGGSNSRAREYFEKAVAIAPNEPLNYQFLSSLLRYELGEKKQALETAEAGAAIAVKDPDRLESIEAQKILTEWIKSWK